MVESSLSSTQNAQRILDLMSELMKKDWQSFASFAARYQTPRPRISPVTAEERRHASRVAASFRGKLRELLGPQVSTRKLCRHFEIPVACQHCGTKSKLSFRSSRTAYWEPADTPLKDSPNRPVLLCDHCAELHNTHWDNMWDEYYTNCR